jgi:hypothetical protein
LHPTGNKDFSALEAIPQADDLKWTVAFFMGAVRRDCHPSGPMHDHFGKPFARLPLWAGRHALSEGLTLRSDDYGQQELFFSGGNHDRNI